MPVRREGLAVVLLPLLIAAASGPPSASGLGTDDPFGPLLAAVALLAWACSGWLLLALLLSVAGRAGSRSADLLLQRVAPASVRALCGVVVGSAVVLAPSTATAFAELPSPAPVSDVDLDWGQPVTRPTATAPAPATKGTTRPVPVPRTRSEKAPPAVVVEAGDSLWAIAARALGPGADDEQIALAWPRWWQANRALIGNDPDLIHPGAVLASPQHLGEP